MHQPAFGTVNECAFMPMMMTMSAFVVELLAVFTVAPYRFCRYLIVAVSRVSAPL